VRTLPHHRHHTCEKSALLLRVLRQKARATRNKKPKEFYSIREVAGHFGVPLTTVSRVYTQLKTEGLLTTVWGSKTFVAPTGVDRGIRVRGVVALPAALVSFCAVREYRNFFTEICDALWKFGFATELLFYQENEAELPMFAERVLKHRVDIVIWFLPVPKLKQTVARLIDRGIRVITVADLAEDCRGYGYCVDREPAIRDAFLSWRKHGIGSVTVLQNSRCKSSGTLTLVEKCLRDAAIPYSFANTESLDLEDIFAPRAQQMMSGIIFPSSEVAVPLVMRDPVGFAKLSQRSSILLMGGQIDAPGLSSNNLSTDALELDIPVIAKTIASDLIQPTRARSAASVAFRAKWLPTTIKTLTPNGSVRHVAMLKRTGVGDARIAM
jgi:hypothetical protein